jgi:hypothetical protein
MTTIEKLRQRTGVALTVLSLVGGGLIFGPAAASAQVPPLGTCINDVWKWHENKQNVTCTANDVTLSTATNIDIDTGGSCVNGVCSCFAGQMVTFSADFQMDLTADARYDVGFYLATDADPNNDGALNGTCTATASLAGNTANFRNLDAAPDVCGDITGPFNAPPPDNNPLFVRATITAPCPSTPGQQLRLPFATTWRQPGSNQVCRGTGNGTTTNDVFPGSPSKCNTGTLVLDITSISTTIDVTKTALTNSVPETGGDATYSVTVENTSAIAVTLTSLTDDPYGDITAVQGGITATTCVADANAATCEVGGVIAANGSCSCTFTATVPPGDFGGDPFADVAEVCANNATNPTATCDTDDAEVPYSDVSFAPTLTKTASASQCVVDTTYDVVVNNSNTTETLTVNSLTDVPYGDITQVQGNVVSTTCGVPQLITPAGNYSCQFVGRINSCDLSRTNTVTGGTVDEDGVPFTPSDSATVVVSVTRPTP